MVFNMRQNMIQNHHTPGKGGGKKKRRHKKRQATEQVSAVEKAKKMFGEAVQPVEAKHSGVQPVEREIDEYGEQHFEYGTQENTYLSEHPEDVFAHWQGPEYEVHEKSRLWYTVAAIVIALIALYAVLTDSPVMAIVFLVIGAVGFLYVITPPRVLDYAVTVDGIIVGDHIYHYDEIESYWIFYEPPHTRIISFHVKGNFFPYVHVPLHQLDPVEVRRVLSEHLTEKRQEQTAIDIFERLLHI